MPPSGDVSGRFCLTMRNASNGWPKMAARLPDSAHISAVGDKRLFVLLVFASWREQWDLTR